MGTANQTVAGRAQKTVRSPARRSDPGRRHRARPPHRVRVSVDWCGVLWRGRRPCVQSRVRSGDRTAPRRGQQTVVA